jgi:hypothetical protein
MFYFKIQIFVRRFVLLNQKKWKQQDADSFQQHPYQQLV